LNRKRRIRSAHVSLACFGLWLLFGASSLFGQEYFAQGQIEIVTKVLPAGGGKSNSFGFYVESLGNAYKVRIEEMEAKGRYHEYAYRDGVMKWVHHVRVNLDAGARAAPVFPTRIDAREIPPDDGYRAQFVWFALASHRYFAGLTNEYMPPIWSPEDPKTRRQPFSMFIVPDLSDKPPRLPVRVDFINDGFYRTYNPVTKVNEVMPLAAPYNTGYTNATYEVFAWTNTPRNTLPQQFTFTVYSSPLSPGKVPFERVRIRGRLAEAGDNAPEKAGINPFAGEANVVDYRVGSETNRLGQNYLAYSVTNGAWLDSNQLASVRTKVERSRQFATKERSHRSKRWLVVGVMGLITLPIILAFWRELRRKKHP